MIRMIYLEDKSSASIESLNWKFTVVNSKKLSVLVQLKMSLKISNESWQYLLYLFDGALLSIEFSALKGLNSKWDFIDYGS